MSKYLVSINKHASTGYMIKRLGGAANVLSCDKYLQTRRGTHYTIELKDELLISKPNSRLMRLEPIRK